MAVGKTEISQRGTAKGHEETATAAAWENPTKQKENKLTITKQWNGLPREVEEFLSLDIFKT